MEQEKIIQIAVSEIDDSTTYVALSNTGKIFVACPRYDSRTQNIVHNWVQLPCPIEQTGPCKHLRRKDKGSWEKCLDCGENATTYLEDSDADLLEQSQPI